MQPTPVPGQMGQARLLAGVQIYQAERVKVRNRDHANGCNAARSGCRQSAFEPLAGMGHREILAQGLGAKVELEIELQADALPLATERQIEKVERDG